MVARTFESGRAALITGASGGIGLDIARVCADHGHPVVLVARSTEALVENARAIEERYDVAALPLTYDLSEADAPRAIAAELAERGIRVGTLVNNAGFATYGAFPEIGLDEQLAELRLNVETLTALTWLFVRPMIDVRSGRVLNVASTAAFFPGPLMAVYYASKAYVLSFSEALREELRGTGVGVTALCPGVTRTGFQARARMEDSKLVRRGMMDSATVARAAYRGLQQNRALVIPGFSNRLQAVVPRFLPRALAPGIVRRAHERAH
jgi:short-subunit dehydrogenase